MPLPAPKGKEEKNDFISRFMSNETAKKEFPNRKQRVAVAYSKWREAKSESVDIFTMNNVLNERLKIRRGKIVGKGGKVLGKTDAKKKKGKKEALHDRRLELMYIIKNKLKKKKKKKEKGEGEGKKEKGE